MIQYHIPIYTAVSERKIMMGRSASIVLWSLINIFLPVVFSHHDHQSHTSRGPVMCGFQVTIITILGLRGVCHLKAMITMRVISRHFSLSVLNCSLEYHKIIRHALLNVTRSLFFAVSCYFCSLFMNHHHWKSSRLGKNVWNIKVSKCVPNMSIDGSKPFIVRLAAPMPLHVCQRDSWNTASPPRKNALCLLI